MARKKNIHPSMRRDEDEDEDAGIFIGGPEHGAEFSDTSDDFEDENDEDDDDNGGEDDEDDRIAAMERRLNALQTENETLRRSVPPAPVAPAPEPEEEPDWESMLFTDPKRTLELRDERLRKKITSELRGEYNREQSTARFWQDFYRVNDDIDRENEHDLVEATLHSNMAALAPMPTDRAIIELGDLTRKRIMRYSKKPGKNRARNVSEGAAAPTPKKQKREVENNQVTSISSLIRARRAKRVSAA